MAAPFARSAPRACALLLALVAAPGGIRPATTKRGQGAWHAQPHQERKHTAPGGRASWTSSRAATSHSADCSQDWRAVRAANIAAMTCHCRTSNKLKRKRTRIANRMALGSRSTHS